MAAIQHHRGPDGFGWQTMDGVGMSHARLSIIDLDETRGRQPEALAVHDIFACADRSVPHDARHSQSLHRSGVGLTWSWGGPLRYTRCRYDAHIATIMLL